MHTQSECQQPKAHGIAQIACKSVYRQQLFAQFGAIFPLTKNLYTETGLTATNDGFSENGFASDNRTGQRHRWAEKVPLQWLPLQEPDTQLYVSFTRNNLLKHRPELKSTALSGKAAGIQIRPVQNN